MRGCGANLQRLLIHCNYTSGDLNMRGIRVRGLKTFTAGTGDDVKSKFLPAWIKQHLFYGGSHSDEPDTDSVNPSVKGMRLPSLYGNSIQSHIEVLSERQHCDYATLLKGLASGHCPSLPVSWVFQSGWTCYRSGSEPYKVDFPDEDALIFDAEVCVRESFAPVLATAVSSSAWYSWTSPALIDECHERKQHVFTSDLVSLGNKGQRPRVVVGHHVCFDSARVQEGYDLPMSGLKFFDTMAAHIAVSGVTDLQRYVILKAAEKPEWAKLACSNSLKQLYSLYCDGELDKMERNIFLEGSLSDIAERFQELCLYCALDVKATHSVFSKLLPLYFERFPHGATLNAMLEMSSMFIPVVGKLENVVGSAAETSTADDKEVKMLLGELAEDALMLLENDRYKTDPWMWDQDWSISPKKKNQDANNPSQPKWFKKLVAEGSNEGNFLINIRRYITPKLMQLCWGRYPLHYEHALGWGMLIPTKSVTVTQKRNVPVEDVKFFCESFHTAPRITTIPSIKDFISLHSGITASNSRISRGQYGFKSKEITNNLVFLQNGLLFKRLPHATSLETNSGGPLSVFLLSNQCIRSENAKAQRILSILRKNMFWKKNGKFFETLPVVWFDKEISKGAVVPSASACGDFIRHPKETLFSSLCTAESRSTGIELSAACGAPQEWCFLSANIPQADIWMVSLLADSKHECCASRLGQMFVEGTVYRDISEGLKLSSLQSKLVFHAVIWGASRRYIAKLLKEINPLLGESTVYERTDKLLKYLFKSPNTPEAGLDPHPEGVLSSFQEVVKEISKKKVIASPVLQSRLSRVLESDAQHYFPLIQNWLVRSSVADYLHVLMLCFRDFQPNARLCLVSSYPLFIKYLVPNNKKYQAAKSLHVAHLYSAAYCSAKFGLFDVPKIAAQLPFVALNHTLGEDTCGKSLKLSFEEALKHSASESGNDHEITQQ